MHVDSKIDYFQRVEIKEKKEMGQAFVLDLHLSLLF